MLKLRILLADDHAMLRDGLSVLLNGQTDMEVVAQAMTGREAVRLACEHAPDVAVVDISLPDTAGVEAAHRMAEQAAQVGLAPGVVGGCGHGPF